MMKLFVIGLVGLVLIGASERAQAQTNSKPAAAPRVTFESGVSYWHSTSMFKVNLGRPKLISRLTFKKMTSPSVEVFERLNVGRLFLKLNLGLGLVTSGQYNDEDWKTSDIAYSDTLSQVSGNISSLTVDVGLIVVKKENRKVGVFVGYNYFTQKNDLYGCRQLTGYNTCRPGDIPDSQLIGIMDVAWKSLRVGTTAESNLVKRFKIGGEFVFMGTRMTSRDNHLARTYTTWFDGYGYGWGWQAEATATYLINSHLTISGGWRYWSVKADGGNDFCTSYRCQDNGFESFLAKRSGFNTQLNWKF